MVGINVGESGRAGRRTSEDLLFAYFLNFDKFLSRQNYFSLDNETTQRKHPDRRQKHICSLATVSLDVKTLTTLHIRMLSSCEVNLNLREIRLFNLEEKLSSGR